MAHYAQVTEADLKEAAKMTVLNDAEKEGHNQGHTAADSSRAGRSEGIKDIAVSPDNCGNNLQLAGTLGNTQNSEKWAILDLNQ